MHYLYGGFLRAHPLPITTDLMSSPTGTRDPEANTPPTLHKAYRKPTPLNEHELFLASNSSPDAPTTIPKVSPTRSILNEIAIQLNLQENREELVRSWSRFTRKQIGLIASLKALGLSSCTINSLPLVIE